MESMFIIHSKKQKQNPKAQGLFTKAELEEILPEGAEILASKD